jgi:hypothetical protein
MRITFVAFAATNRYGNKAIRLWNLYGYAGFIYGIETH